MNQVELTAVEKHYGEYHALRNVDLAIPEGAFVALIGPSGCGKSTLLRAIAGLEKISSGTISIAGQRVNDVPPRRRDVAMVFQSYALYPHMDVRRNMTYSLRLRRRSADVIAAAVSEAAATLNLSELLARYPRELSGGQRQRVAMGRAIVRHPKVFLFDEPLSNLDAELRVKMRGEVRALHERLGATSVYVTHDQIEAMTMADHIVVLRAGRIEQQGRPLDLYDRPANRFVAGFIGSPSMNFLSGSVTADGEHVAWDGLDRPLALGRRLSPSRPVQIGLRPEHLAVSPEGAIPLVVATIERTGSQTIILGSSGGQAMTVIDYGRPAHARGDRFQLAVRPEHIHVFDPDSGAAV